MGGLNKTQWNIKRICCVFIYTYITYVVEGKQQYDENNMEIPGEKRKEWLPTKRCELTYV